MRDICERLAYTRQQVIALLLRVDTTRDIYGRDEVPSANIGLFTRTRIDGGRVKIGSGDSVKVCVDLCGVASLPGGFAGFARKELRPPFVTVV